MLDSEQEMLLSQFGCDALVRVAIFGSSDIYIADLADRAAYSHSFLGTIYRHAKYANRSSEAKWLLAGNQNLKFDEIWVYKSSDTILIFS